MKFLKRETDILKALKTLVETKLDFVVVGEFAVSGLTRHRFSVDCDVVVARRELEKLERILEREGFTKHVERAGFDEVYGGEFTSYKKEVEELPVTFDLLVGSLFCRATDAAWTCRVPEKELLIALKIHSARKADIRDVVMLRERADFEKVLKHLRKGREEALRDQIIRVIQALKDPRLVDSLKGVFTLSIDVTKQIENTRKEMENILKAFQ